jgi:hypothetical protein
LGPVAFVHGFVLRQFSACFLRLSSVQPFDIIQQSPDRSLRLTNLKQKRNRLPLPRWLCVLCEGWVFCSYVIIGYYSYDVKMCTGFNAKRRRDEVDAKIIKHTVIPSEAEGSRMFAPSFRFLHSLRSVGMTVFIWKWLYIKLRV